MAGAGQGLVTNQTITFDDEAAAWLPQSNALVAGSYRPTTYETNLLFPEPAPTGPYGLALAEFIGTVPNGIWSLFVRDRAAKDSGQMVGGWSLHLGLLETASAPPESSLVRLEQAALADAGGFQFTLRGEAGRRYRLESSTDLLHWTEVRTEVLSEGVMNVLEPCPDPQQFYRAVELP
jgi:hypothetical protein